METLRNYNLLTDEELSERIKKLGDMMEMMNPCDDAWDEAYREYFAMVDVQNERYRKANQSDFDAFYEKNIKGKSINEIDPETWSWYSDWHKDMYGHRPRHI